MNHDALPVLPTFKVSSRNAKWTDDGRGHPIAKVSHNTSDGGTLRYSSWGPQSGKSPGFSSTFFLVGALAAWALVAYKVRREYPTNGRDSDYSDRDRDGFDDFDAPEVARQHTGMMYTEGSTSDDDEVISHGYVSSSERTRILSFGSDGDSCAGERCSIVRRSPRRLQTVKNYGAIGDDEVPVNNQCPEAHVVME